MRRLMLLILFWNMRSVLHAQSIPVFGNTDTTKKISKVVQNKTAVVKATAVNNNPTTAAIKFVCDTSADLYIDGNPKGSITKTMPMVINLPKGEYLVQAISSGNFDDWVEFKYTVDGN